MDSIRLYIVIFLYKVKLLKYKLLKTNFFRGYLCQSFLRHLKKLNYISKIRHFQIIAKLFLK